MKSYAHIRRIYDLTSTRLLVCYDVAQITLQRSLGTALLLLLFSFSAEETALGQNYLVTLSDLSEELAPYQGIGRFDGMGEGIWKAQV